MSRSAAGEARGGPVTSWDGAAVREGRKRAYFDAILVAVSEAGGSVPRDRLIATVAGWLPGMGDAAWHVDRMAAAMVRAGSLVREGGRFSLNSPPGAQQNR